MNEEYFKESLCSTFSRPVKRFKNRNLICEQKRKSHIQHETKIHSRHQIHKRSIPYENGNKIRLHLVTTFLEVLLFNFLFDISSNCRPGKHILYITEYFI